MSVEVWGVSARGDTVQRVTISDGTLTASVITLGASVQDLRLAGHDAPLVLGFPRLKDYEAQPFYIGATAGRVANRIKDGRFTLDGLSFQANQNFLGKHTLHGGQDGISQRDWVISELRPSSVSLSLFDPDGHQGFPGELKITNEYRIEDGALRVLIHAETDAPTLCNIAHHSYFNLADGGVTDCLEHELMIKADQVTVLDDEQLPTGALSDVSGSPLDFLQLTPVGRIINGKPFVHDHNYCIGRERQSLRQVAAAHSAKSGVTMTVATTEPGLQLYTGKYLTDSETKGLTGRPYKPFAGFCLEAQAWPDAPNYPHFPQITLRPGENYAQETVYAFRRD
jgi:aldose 1-epimerase